MDFETGNQKGQLIAALQQLSQSNSRSKRARLIEIFDDVEATLLAGATQKRVIAALATNGLVFTLRSFETTRARIKKERKERNSREEQIPHFPSPTVETPMPIKSESREHKAPQEEPTGFHRVAAELAERQRNGDPRRNE